jgi:hypothetical protein
MHTLKEKTKRNFQNKHIPQGKHHQASAFLILVTSKLPLHLHLCLLLLVSKQMGLHVFHNHLLHSGDDIWQCCHTCMGERLTHWGTAMGGGEHTPFPAQPLEKIKIRNESKIESKIESNEHTYL